MELNKLIKEWFSKWQKGDYLNLPDPTISHTQVPLGKSVGKNII